MFYVSLCIMLTSLKTLSSWQPWNKTNWKITWWKNWRHSINNNSKWLPSLYCFLIALTISNYSYSNLPIKLFEVILWLLYLGSCSWFLSVLFVRLLMSLSKERKRPNGELPYWIPVAFWWLHCLVDNFLIQFFQSVFPLITQIQLKI